MSNKHLNKSECLQRRLFAVSFLCGFLIAMFCLSPRADEARDIEISGESSAAPTITIDAEHGVDYKEVDRYISHMNTQKVKYAKTKDNEIILSEEPIVEIPKYLARPAVQPTFEAAPYAPITLADLGMQYSPENNVAPAERVQLADNQLRAAPTVPEFVAVPVTAIHEAPATQTQYSNIHNKLTEAISPTFMYAIRAIFAAGGLIILLMLYASSRRRDAPALYKSRYTGKLGIPTEMVGEGGLFNFDDTKSIQKIPLNATYLTMMWHLGRLSTDSHVNTYFYMAFYIPPNQQYAAELRKKQESETV